MGHKEEILYCEGGEALAQVAQRSCGCPLPGSVQGQVRWGFEHPRLVKVSLPMAGGLELGGLYKVPSNPNHSMILYASIHICIYRLMNKLTCCLNILLCVGFFEKNTERCHFCLKLIALYICDLLIFP